MTPRRWTRRLALLGVLCLSGASCQKLASELRKTQEPQVLKSWDGAFQVTVPPGWRTDRDLHEKADLGVSKRTEENYLVVLSESTQDFTDMDLQRHSDATLKTILGSLKSSNVGPVLRMSVAGQPALQYEIAGVSGNLKVKYLHTTVELGGYYHQILAWTLASRWDRNKDGLRAAVLSFRQARPPGSR